MSGYGRPDEEQENAQAMVDNAIALARMMIHKGESSKVCHDCGNSIPEARREASRGCKYCIECQPKHDRMPIVKVVTRML
jgi:phage/conjugal plasmid C-4 type zinc finger TraR family protein